MWYKQFFLLIFLVSSSNAFAKNFCDDFFAVEPVTRDQMEAITLDFSQNLDLEKKSTWVGYLRNPHSLQVINEYLREWLPPLQKNMTILKADREVSGGTLVRVGQWHSLFQNSKPLPIGTTLYHTKKMSEQRVRRLSKALLIFEGEYLVTTRSYLPLAEQSKGDEWQVVYRLNLQEEIKAIPGRAELEEYILDRKIKLRVQGSYFDEARQLAYINFNVENTP